MFAVVIRTPDGPTHRREFPTTGDAERYRRELLLTYPVDIVHIEDMRPPAT